MQKEDRYETVCSGHSKYKSRSGEAKTVEHWGQRKLLMSEIEFLTNYATDNCTVVYVGAAPGTHINYMSNVLFPKLNFILIDPLRFNVSETDKIKIVNEWFTVCN